MYFENCIRDFNNNDTGGKRTSWLKDNQTSGRHENMQLSEKRTDAEHYKYLHTG